MADGRRFQRCVTTAAVAAARIIASICTVDQCSGPDPVEVTPLVPTPLGNAEVN